MNCRNFGIGLIVLSVTLFFGITISELLELKEFPEIAVVEESVLILDGDNLKNCVPKDKSLIFQTLPYSEETNHYMKIEEDSELIIIPVPEEIEKKKTADSAKEKKGKQEIVEDSPLPISELDIALPVEDSAESKTLLHKEICHETENGRK